MAYPATAQENQSRIRTIDDSVRVILPHSTHPLARPAADLGRLKQDMRMERMLLVMGPSDEMQHPLRTFLDSLHDKQFPGYHKWLTPQQFGESFGPAQADIAKIAAWLQQRGFDGIKVANGRSHIEFSGNVQMVEQAFTTEMHFYQVGAGSRVANARNISIPQAMAGLVRGVTLHNLSSIRPAITGVAAARRDASGHWTQLDPGTTTTMGANFLSPPDFARIYNLKPLYNQGITGSGSTIAVVARSNISLADMETFRTAFNLPANDPQVVITDVDPGILGGGESAEVSLDSEWSGAVAPGATVKVVISSSTLTTDGVFLSASYIVDNNVADIMTVSFEACESRLTPEQNAFVNATWQQAAAEGISVFVASGDQGAADCDSNGLSPGPATGGLAVNGLASTPFNTAVGGTEFNENGNQATYWAAADGLGQASVLGYIPEVVWNESCDPTKSTTCPANNQLFSFLAGGGGQSTLYSKPSYQSAAVPGMPNDTTRDLPDISLSSAVHDGYLICATGIAPCEISGSGTQTQIVSAGAVGGTSAASPSFAGIMALVDQKEGGRQGLANFGLYRLAINENFANCNSSQRTDPNTPPPTACVFNDITMGNNGIPGNDVLGNNPPAGNTPGQLGYDATAGFDLGSGLGSVNAANLVNSWSSAGFLGSSTTLSASGATTIQHGQPLNLNITVQALSSGNSVPTGNVALIANIAPLPAALGTAAGNVALTNGAFNGGVSSLPGGAYNLIAHYGGDTTFGGSDSKPLAVNITPENSTVTLAAFDFSNNALPSPISEAYGFPLVVHVVVSSASGNGVATGTVTFSDGGTVIANAPLNSHGEAELINCSPALCLTMGQHTITASYSGDNSLNPSSATQPLSFTITQGRPAILLASVGFDTDPTGNSQFFEEFAYGFFFGVGNILPTGTVTYFDNFNGSNTAISPPLPASGPGSTQISTFTLGLGTHNVTVQYSGDSLYAPATSGAITVPVAPNSKPATQTVLNVTGNSFVVGQITTVNVSVTSSQPNPVPTGEVGLVANDRLFNFLGVGSAPVLNNGAATTQIIIPSTFTQIIGTYTGDSIYAPSVSPPVNITVAKATPASSINSNMQVVQAGRQMSLTALVTGPARAFTPTGTVQFFDAFNGGQPQPFGTPQFVLGQAPPFFGPPGQVPALAAIPAFLPAGTHVFTFSYSGDANYNAVPASSNSVTVVAASGSTLTTVMPLTSQMTVGQPATFAVSVAATQGPGVPTGAVVLNAGGATDLNSPVALSGGSANIQINMPLVVSQISARYLGDSTFGPSISVPAAVNVAKGTPAVSISANALTVNPGIPVNLLLNVTTAAGAINPSGTVQFFNAVNGGNPAPLAPPQSLAFFTQTSGQVALSSITLPVGTNVITASYSGDDNYNAVAASNSVPLTITVGTNVFQFTAPNGTSQTISAGQTATYNLVVNANGFGGRVTFTCNVSLGIGCTVAPSPVVFNGGNSVPLVVNVTPSSTTKLMPSGFHRFPFAFAACFALVLVGLMRRRRALLVLAGLCLTACGGSPTIPMKPPPTVTIIVVTGTSGTTNNSISLTLTVNH
jgi:hypothetical protein